MRKISLLLVSVTLVFSAGYTEARDPFDLTVQVLDDTGFRSFSSIEDFINALDNDTLDDIVPSYTSVSPALATLDIRGLRGIARYDADSAILSFSIPSLSIEETFAGSTRDESEELFEEWWKGEGGDTLTRVLREMVAKTPIDPVAGNPNSLMGQMVAADFASAGIISVPPGADEEGEGAQGEVTARETRNLLGFAARFGSYSADDFETDVITLPLDYTFTLADPRWAVVVDVPLTYVETSGAQSFSGSLGVGLRVPFGNDWALVPAVRFGAVGSLDLGSAAMIGSASLTSNYEFEFGNSTLSLTNMLGFYETFSISVGDYDVDYDLTNYVTRNGLIYNQILPFEVLNQDTSFELAAVNTQFFGDELYVGNYTELSATFGTYRRDGLVAWNALRLGFTYTIGENDYKGWRISFGYRF